MVFTNRGQRDELEVTPNNDEILSGMPSLANPDVNFAGFRLVPHGAKLKL